MFTAAPIGISMHRRRPRRKNRERDRQIAELWSTGLTLQAVGDKFGMTRERVRQIIGRYKGKYEAARETAKYAWQDEATALLKDGHSIQHVATALSRSLSSVTRLLDGSVYRAHKEARFWSYVDKSDGPDACWPWTRARTAYGYGRYSMRWLKDTNSSAHRAAWRLANDSGIPEHLHVLHRCDNPPCCNPAHLYLGTPAQNAKDSVERGKRRQGRRAVTPDTVRQQIVEGYQAGLSGPKLAIAHRIDTPTVYAILHRAGVKIRPR
jgi:DNA-binding CsgD family transcriptional regulator